MEPVNSIEQLVPDSSCSLKNSNGPPSSMNVVSRTTVFPSKAIVPPGRNAEHPRPLDSLVNRVTSWTRLPTPDTVIATPPPRSGSELRIQISRSVMGSNRRSHPGLDASSMPSPEGLPLSSVSPASVGTGCAGPSASASLLRPSLAIELQPTEHSRAQDASNPNKPRIVLIFMSWSPHARLPISR